MHRSLSSLSSAGPIVALLAAASLIFTAPPTPAHAAEPSDQEVSVTIEAVPGLQYSKRRFQVPAGARVRLTLVNTDEMMHNLVITTIGGRLDVVNEALQLGAAGPERDYVPDSPEVLHHIRVLSPDESQTITFTAPKKEGAYPYVCSYPGHGFIMYGAMYVGEQDLPPLSADPNIPHIPAASDMPATDPAAGANQMVMRPQVTRTFMRDSGPASIAVALPHEQAYCWDAGACRLRYAWRGGMVDQRHLMLSKADGFANVPSRIYYRAGAGFPLRIGSPENKPEEVEFLGYRLIDGYPEFEYEVDGVRVRELIRGKPEGSGLVRTFEVDSTGQPVYFVADPESGAEFSSPAGRFSQGVLKLSPEQARKFTVVLTEVPRELPLRYYSMDDEHWRPNPQPVDGVVGRAVLFDGKRNEIKTGISTDDLEDGATITFWARADDPSAGLQAVIGAKQEEGGYLFIGFYGEHFGFGITNTGPGGQEGTGGSIAAARVDDPPSGWHFYALRFSEDGSGYRIDGGEWSSADWNKVRADDLPIFIGSEGESNYFKGTLDEVRIYDRTLSDAEVRELYQNGKSHLESDD